MIIQIDKCRQFSEYKNNSIFIFYCTYTYVHSFCQTVSNDFDEVKINVSGITGFYFTFSLWYTCKLYMHDVHSVSIHLYRSEAVQNPGLMSCGKNWEIRSSSRGRPDSTHVTLGWHWAYQYVQMHFTVCCLIQRESSAKVVQGFPWFSRIKRATNFEWNAAKVELLFRE